MGTVVVFVVLCVIVAFAARSIWKGHKAGGCGGECGGCGKCSMGQAPHDQQ